MLASVGAERSEKVVFMPRQTVSETYEAFGAEPDTFTTRVSEAIHPMASVTSTQYVAGRVMLMVSFVPPVDHRYDVTSESPEVRAI